MTNIKNYFNRMGIDWRYLAIIALVILSPFIYNSIRVFWVVDQGDSSLAMTHFSTYLQMTMEIVGAFLLIPLFTYKSEEYNKNSLTLFINITAMMIIFVVAGLIISGALIHPMMELNPEETKSNITWYMIFQTLTWVLVVYEQYLLVDFLVERKISKALIFAILSLTLKIVFDVFMLSSISFIEPNIVMISLSSFISSLIVVATLVVVHVFKMKEEGNLNLEKFNWNSLKTYYTRGVIPASELLIRNLCYSLVTLQALLMLGENDWNAWNMGGYIYWMMIFKITSIFDYYLISELSNNDNEERLKLFAFSIIEVVIIFVMGVLLSSTYLPTLVNGSEYASKAILLSFVNLPIMMLIAIQNVFKTKLITSNNYVYLFAGTIINLIVLYIPVMIIIYLTSVQIGFWANYAIFGISCLIPSVITVISVLWLQFKEKESIDEEAIDISGN